eukprot:363073-Chlamydomonas_euryale.AAC.6
MAASSKGRAGMLPAVTVRRRVLRLVLLLPLLLLSQTAVSTNGEPVLAQEETVSVSQRCIAQLLLEVTASTANKRCVRDCNVVPQSKLTPQQIGAIRARTHAPEAARKTSAMPRPVPLRKQSWAGYISVRSCVATAWADSRKGQFWWPPLGVVERG